MINSMSVVHSLSFSSLKGRKSSVHYESSENWIYSIAPGNSLNHLFHDDFVVCFILCKFQPCTTRIEFCPLLVTEILCCQNLLGKDFTRCFMMISMCVGHSLSISFLRRITNSVHYGSFGNCIYSLLDGHS